MSRPTPIVIACLWWGLVGSASAAGEPGSPILSQELRFDFPVASKGLEGLLLTRVGQPFDPTLADRSVRRLLSTDLFSQVTVEERAEPAGIRLIYRLVKRRRIGSIRFTGNFLALDRQLRQALQLMEGAPLTDPGFARERQALVDFYEGRGIFNTGVEVGVREDPRTGDYDVRFRIREGEPARVLSVEFEGNTYLPAAQLSTLLESREGETYEGEKFQQDLHRIEERYLGEGFFSVTVKGEVHRQGEDGVRLGFSIREGPETRVRFEGNRTQAEAVLQQRLTFRQERVVDEYEVEASRTALERFYREKGYPQVHVEAELREPNGGREVHFRIQEGPRLLIVSLNFHGNDRLPARLFTRYLKSRSGAPYVRSWIEEDQRTIGAVYRREGFFQAAVEVREEFTPSGDGIRATFVITEDPRTHVGIIRIEGNQALSRDAIGARLLLKPGAPLRAEGWEADRNRLLDLYGEAGYIYSEVVADLAVHLGEPVADLIYRIRESHRARLGALALAGNERTRDYVLRREFPLRRGDPYDAQRAILGQRNLSRLGYIRSVRLIPMEPETEPEEVDLLLQVEERPGGLLGVGAGYSTEERLRGFVEVGHRNLWGTGRSLKLRLKLSEIGHREDLTYAEPWLLGRRVAGEVGVFNEFQERRGFNIRQTGVATTAGKDLTERLKGALQYKYEDVRLSHIRDPLVSLEDEGVHQTSSFSASLSYDFRDDLLDPTRGAFYGATATVGGGPLFGRDDFWKTQGEGSWFLPLPERTVLALSVRGGVAGPYGRSERLPIQERFFAGGSTSLRGFKDRHLGPTDAGGTPKGGEAMLLSSVEARIPLYQNIGGVAFLDGGQVWRTVKEVTLGEVGDLKWGAGLGLRLKTPIGPVRLDWAYLLQPVPRQDRWRFYFTLGQAF